MYVKSGILRRYESKEEGQDNEGSGKSIKVGKKERKGTRRRREKSSCKEEWEKRRESKKKMLKWKETQGLLI